MWSTQEEWIKFRTTPHSGHVPSQIPTLIRDDFLPSSAGKRKRGETAEETVSMVKKELSIVAATWMPLPQLMTWMLRRPQRRKLPTDGSGASAAPTGSASEPVNPIGFGLYKESRVQNLRRLIDFVCDVTWPFAKIVLDHGMRKKGCFRIQQQETASTAPEETEPALEEV